MRLNEIIGVNKDKIEEVLKKYQIKNYIIHDDGTVDVEGNVDLSRKKFTNLPVNFGEVMGSFFCYHCPNLKSLQGAPKSVGGNFSCSDCPNLVSLQGAPKSISGNFQCSNCPKLVSLQGAPELISGSFYCRKCPDLTSLQGAPKSIGGYFNCTECLNLKIILPILKTKRLKKFEMGNTEIDKIINKYLPTNDILGCQEELIEAGYEEYVRIK